MALPAYGYSEDHPKVVSECPGHSEICNALPELGHAVVMATAGCGSMITKEIN
jgi:hypothetical protein